MSKKKPIRIFILDDDKVFTLALKGYIETAFVYIAIEIYPFETEETFMEKYKNEKVHVVIVNYKLKEKSSDIAGGIQILNWIKKENYDTHVIILTDEDSIDIALKSFQNGASDYLVKTETIFRKINYSLLNILKMIDSKRELLKYKIMAVGLFICIVIFFGTFVV